jgi:hypothetical protein
MNINPNATKQAKSRGWKFWAILSIALIFSLACLLLFFLVVFHDYYHGVASYESAAVGSLRRINELEGRYSVEHTKGGFACELSLLRPTAHMSGTDGRNEIFVNGEQREYRFKIVGCAAEPSGIVTHYQIVAVPLRPGVIGIRAFCTDQSGEVFYDPDASAPKCLAARKVLPRTMSSEPQRIH